MKKEQVDYKENLIGELCRNEFGWRLHRRNKVVFLTGLFLTCYFFALFLPPYYLFIISF